MGVPPLLAAVVMLVTVADRGANSFGRPSPAELSVVLAGSGVLLLRLRAPVVVAAVAMLAGAALPQLPPHPVLIDVPSIVAIYTVATLRRRRTTWILVAVAIVLLTAAAAPWRPAGPDDLSNLVPANYVIFSAVAGLAVRNRRELLVQVQERAVLTERNRIARELHDIVTHHLTIVNAQAGVAHHLLRTHPDKAAEALAGIRDTSRAALDDLRAAVGVLRQEQDGPADLRPAPGLADLDELIDAFRLAGVGITVTRTGAPSPLPATTDLAAFRIAQEALTNGSKHGIGRYIELAVAYDRASVRITVSNDAVPGRQGPGTGHGLIGMRERAAAAGGHLEAGFHGGSTFEVRAELPVRRTADAVHRPFLTRMRQAR